jgi:hypothetical protein
VCGRDAKSWLAVQWAERIMREDQEEIRVRMAFLAKNYSLIGSKSQAA